jgi:NAD(P)-dependent dehydrogenase (short-subunit alcohol dehydrogenase family)
VGVQQPAEIAEGSLDEYERFWAVNVRGVLNCLKAVTRVMKKQVPNTTIPGRLGPREAGRGVIINMGSCNSYIATRHIAQYTMSKHAVLGLTRNAGKWGNISVIGDRFRAEFTDRS